MCFPVSVLRLLFVALLLCTLAQPARAQTVYDTTTVQGQPAVVVTERDQAGIAARPGQQAITWSSDYLWVLDGLVFVNDGQQLTIAPGTVIKGRPGKGARPASALVVAQGGQLFARGTAQRPIIFTALKDDLSRTDDLPPNFRGGWGGLVILGRAPLNTYPTVLNTEVISLNDRRSIYGGSRPNDNSGVLRYVSIRYGGTSAGSADESKTAEFNGLTLAGVGRRTTIEYVEVYNNNDDNFEWFGGTVNAKYLVAAFATDDSFDMDQGYRGRGQFWLALQNSIYADRAFELDGGDADFGGEDRRPYATPIIYNATIIGSGLAGKGSTALYMRDNFAGAFYNSIIASFPEEALWIEDKPGAADSQTRFAEGTLQLKGNLFYAIGGTMMAGSGSAVEGLVENDGPLRRRLTKYLARHNRIPEAAPLRTIGRDTYGTLTALDPTATNAARTFPGLQEPATFFKDVDFIGAFGERNWALSWTYIGQGGAQYPGLELLQSSNDGTTTSTTR
ncbi:hypothetical protein [Salisaeta longa]|uniref:hypothetical protein n=1 Tax=Salisaeta longa TaxID=503170 RepID=UPI0003B5B44B|nr:hypothetical protein [Salisaeta longa]